MFIIFWHNAIGAKAARQMSSFCTNFLLRIRSKTVITEKLSKTLLYKKAARKNVGETISRLSNRDKIESTRSRSSEMMKLRRSTSESKMEKDRRNEERAVKSRSVHFDGNKKHGNFSVSFFSLGLVHK